jgi:heterodisulfide reductase subunit B
MTQTKRRILSYFPGCSLEASNRAYDVSTRNVARVLGIEMVELEDWNCCGATAYMAINEQKSFVLSGRNLALSERLDRDLVTVCSGCYLALHKTNHYFNGDPRVRDEVRKALQAGGLDYRGTVRVRHFLDVVANDLGREVVERHVVRPWHGLRVACYYGCQISRPFGDIDDPEFPASMDRLVQWLGAEPVAFPVKAKCCGGMLMTTNPQIGRELSGKILRAARRARADCVVTACPLCQMNLEAYQDRISDAMGEECRLPVLYFTQLLGGALGLDDAELALGDSLTEVKALFMERQAAP